MHKNMLSIPFCRKTMSKLEDKYGGKHSLNNITTLSGLVYRFKTIEHLQHVMS